MYLFLHYQNNRARKRQGLCLDACPLNKTNLRSLYFSVNRFFNKLFKTSDMHIVTEIQSAFGFRPPSAIITDRFKTFLYKI